MGRRVKRIDNAFTLEGIHQLKHNDRLCDSCGMEVCPMRDDLARLEVHHFARADVRSCEHYVPILSFQDMTGLDQPCNTFRLGHGYAERLRAGCVVSLSGPGERRYAEVTAVHRGSFSELEHLKVDNHLLIGCEHPESVDFFAIVRGIYGPHLVNRDSNFTVIYFKPL